MKSIPILTDKTVSIFEKSLRKRAQAKYLKTGLPFVTLKFAQTLDGKIAAATGDSRWISGSSSHRFAHQLRSFHDAVLVGVDTIIQDDPRLTVRLVKGENPQRIIVDSHLRTPLDSNVLKGRAAFSTIIATTSLSTPQRIDLYRSKGIQVWILLRRDHSNQVDLSDLWYVLGQKDIRSVLVEGGSKIISSFVGKRLVDHLFIIIAPKIIGKGITGLNLSTPRRHDALNSFSSLKLFQSGDDIILSLPVQK